MYEWMTERERERKEKEKEKEKERGCVCDSAEYVHPGVYTPQHLLFLNFRASLSALAQPHRDRLQDRHRPPGRSALQGPC